MKDSCIQTNSSSRDPIFAKTIPDTILVIFNVQRRGISDGVLHRAVDDEIHAEEFNIVSSTFNLARARR